jgi:hypothetical protein
VALVPNHVFKSLDGDTLVRINRHVDPGSGGNFTHWFSEANSYQLPGRDLRLVCFANGGQWRDIRKFLPSERVCDFRGYFVKKKQDRRMEVQRIMATPGSIKLNCGAVVDGFKYDLNRGTMAGDCIATLICEGKTNVIAGVHLGGIPGKVHAVGAALTRSEIDDAISMLKNKISVVVATSEEPLPEEQYDIPLKITSAHPASPFVQAEDGQFKMFGSVPGRATFRSEVHKLPISDSVEEYCGQACEYGPPKVKEADSWNVYANHFTHTSHGMPPRILERSLQDYLKKLLTGTALYCREENPRPLDEIEVVSGIDGKRFIDAMKMSTALGVPLKGKKSTKMIELPPTETHACPRTFTSDIWEQVQRARLYLREGRRVGFIAKASLKDEPVKLTKAKQRVFEGTPVALQMLTREYFLPLARIFSVFPLVSECAVGVNTYGDEWEQLMSYVTKYGPGRIVAGDFSKFDVTISAQLTFAAFRVFIELSKQCSGYTDDDRKVMESLASEICYSLVNFNGDLVQLHGSNPSGNSLTVYINSIVVSLILRGTFYSKQQHWSLDFDSVVALITYGDDCTGSSSTNELNHLDVANFCQEIGMKFTMPDKEASPVPFMNIETVDFLKRKSVFHTELGCRVGALDESSIFKSLHVGLKSQLTPDEQCAENMDTALREWFYHGKEMYEMRRTQIRKIAEKHNLTEWCRVLDMSYEDHVVRWKAVYRQGDEQPTTESVHA